MPQFTVNITRRKSVWESTTVVVEASARREAGVLAYMTPDGDDWIEDSSPSYDQFSFMAEEN